MCTVVKWAPVAMAEHACTGGSITGPKVLYPSDVEAIYRLCL